MIIKKVTKNRQDSSLTFLADYLEKSKQNSEDTRVADRFFFNLGDKAFDLQTCATDMLNLMKQNDRVKSSKYTHYVLSLEHKQELSHDEWNDILTRTLRTLDLEDYQAFAVMHCDTDNQHVHLVVNNINPRTHNIAPLSNDTYKLSKLRQEFNQELDLKFNKNINLNLGHSKTNSNLYELEKYRDVQSFTSYVSQLKDDLFKANSWQEFFKVLQDNGVTYSQHGNGYVFQSLDKKFATKASSINRNFVISKLEQKFGKMEQSMLPEMTSQPAKQYVKKKHTKQGKYVISFTSPFKEENSSELVLKAKNRGDKIHDNGNNFVVKSDTSDQTLMQLLVTMSKRIGKDKFLKIKGNPVFERRCYEIAKILQINIKCQLLNLQNVVGKSEEPYVNKKWERSYELYFAKQTQIDEYLRRFEEIDRERERQFCTVSEDHERVHSVRNVPERKVVSNEKRNGSMYVSDAHANNRKSRIRR